MTIRSVYLTCVDKFGVVNMLNCWSASGSKLDIEFEQNDMDIDIHNKRMLFILDETIEKIKLVNIFESIANEPSAFYPHIISEEDKGAILKIQKRYGKQVFRKQRQVSEDDSVVWTEEAKVRETDLELSRILLSLANNETIQQMPDSTWKKSSPGVQQFTKALQDLRNNVEQYIKHNVAQEKAREKFNRRCQQKNEQIKKEISTLEKELGDKKSDLTASIFGKNMMVNRHYAKIDKIQKATKDAIDKRLQEAEVAIAADQEATVGIHETLRNELADATAKYNALLKDHLAMEKQLRTQRSKVENQLAAFIAKFDQDIGEKQAEEEQMQADFEEEKRKYEEIQKKLDQQEEEFEELMLEKAAYEQELLEQKLFIFILNRSARRIQRAYRAYRLSKAQKKKPGKGKGKGKGKKK